MTCGVYIIINTATGEQYIGKAGDIDHRLSQHRSSLRKGKSPHHRLQASWGHYGEECFRFEVLEVIAPRVADYFDWKRLEESERQHIRALRPAFNAINWDPQVQLGINLPRSIAEDLVELGDGNPTRALRLLYEQFQREQATAELYSARKRDGEMYQNPMGAPLPDPQAPQGGKPYPRQHEDEPQTKAPRFKTSN